MATTRQVPTHVLVSDYVLAKSEVVQAGFADEIAWQKHACVQPVTVDRFVREAAWVVLSAGMAERIIRAKFDLVGEALHQWAAVAIVSDPNATSNALRVFAHRGKIEAIVKIAAIVTRMGGSALRSALEVDAESFMRTLPYIGPVTWAHLAKNLGAPIAKSDRHLTRLCAAYRRTTAQALCDEISGWLDEPIAVVDVVLWRYAEVHARRCHRATCPGLPHKLLERAACRLKSSDFSLVDH